MMTSLCKEYYQFMLAQGILGGMMQGIMFPPAMAAVGHYFHARRGIAMGVAVAGSSLGGVIFPIALGRMFVNPTLGFGWTVRIIGFIILALVLVAMALIRPRLPPRHGQIIILSAFKDFSYTSLVIALFLLLWGMYTPFFYLTEYAIAHGMSQNLASYMLAILNAASFFGRVLPGLLADFAGNFNTLLCSGSVTGILLLCWIACKHNAAIIVYAALYGFFSGAIISLMTPCIASRAPTPRHIGTYIGMGMTVIALAGLSGTPITGAMIDRYHSYTPAAIFSGVSCLAGTVLAFVSKLSINKNPVAKV